MKLSDFGTKVMEHLKEYGLDTLTYLPDPGNTIDVLSVVYYHARFIGDMDKSLKFCNDCKKHYDSWDKKNDHDAKKFLLGSLSDKTREKFKPFHSNEDTFAGTWLRLVQHLVTTTSKTYDDKKKEIRQLIPQQFAGQNIETMATKYIELADEISYAGHYSHGLTLNMVDGFLQADKDLAGTFHYQINVLREKVRKMEQDTIFMNQVDQTNKFSKAHLSYRDICIAAIKSYQELRTDNKWEPAKLSRNKQTHLKDFSANLTTAEVLNLIHTVKSNIKSKKRQYSNSEATNHISRYGPHPKKTAHDQNKARRHAKMDKWRLLVPTAGDSLTKEVNGKKFKWCDKCGHWSTTHGTSEHTEISLQTRKETKIVNEVCTNFTTWEPSAWIIEAEEVKSSNYTPKPFNCGHGTCLISSVKHPFNQGNDVQPMTCHRQRKAWTPSPQKYKVKSARDHNQHPAYPLCLQKENIFNHRSHAPTVRARRSLDFAQDAINQDSAPIKRPCRPSRPCTPSRKYKPLLYKPIGTKFCKDFKGHTNQSKYVNHPGYSKHAPKSKYLGAKSRNFNASYRPAICNNKSKEGKYQGKYFCHNLQPRRKPHDTNNRTTHYKSQGIYNHLHVPNNQLTFPQNAKANESGSKSKSFPVIWNTDASVCVSPDMDDFISYKAIQCQSSQRSRR